MNLFSPMFSNESFDLDDIHTYLKFYPEWLSLSLSGLRKEAWRDAGESLVYMQYWHPDIFFGKQVGRVDKLCGELMSYKNYIDTEENRLKIMSWRFRFADEVENMC